MKTARFSVFAVLAALALVAAVPGLVVAATYAYVNTAGEVRTMEASNPDQAIMTAPGIHLHSGVMLVDSSSDQAVVGDQVPVQ